MFSVSSRGIAKIGLVVILLGVIVTPLILIKSFMGNKDEEQMKRDSPFAGMVAKESEGNKPDEKSKLANAINTVKEKSKDAQRVNDMSTLKYVVYLAVTEGEIKLVSTENCTTCSSRFGSDKTDGSGWIKFTVPENKIGLIKYLGVLPVDPVNEGEQVYSYYSDGYQYEINAVMTSGGELYTKDMKEDSGNNDSKLEVGSKLTLMD